MPVAFSIDLDPAPCRRCFPETRRGLIGRIAGLAAVVALALSCVAPARAADRVTLQLRWDHQFVFAGFYAALWQGYYAEADLEVNIRSAFQSGSEPLDPVREVIEGRADFGIGAADILVARDQGAPLVVVASILQNSPVEWYALTETGVSSPADFTALRVVRRVGDLVDVELQAMLRAEGVDPALVPPVPGRADGQYWLQLIDGSVDVVPGYSVATPFHFKRAGVEVTRVRSTAYGVAFYGDSVFTHQRLIDERPDVAARFAAATQRGWLYALEHAEEIADRIARDLSPAIVLEDTQAFNRFQIVPVRLAMLHPTVEPGHVNPRRWAQMHESLRMAGIVQGDLDLASFIFRPAAARSGMSQQLSTLLLIGFPGALVVGLVVGVWAWIITLRRNVRSRTAALVKSESSFRNLIDGSVQGIIVHDGKKPIFVNRAFADMMGCESPADIVAQDSINTFYAPHEQARLQGYWEACLKGEDISESFEAQAVRKGGEMIWLENRVTRIEWSGSPAALVTTVDVTKRKLADEALRSAKEEAERANEAKTKFLVAASHDIRQPLHAMGLFLAALARRITGTDNRRVLSDLQQSYTSMEGLLNALLDVSKLDAGMVAPALGDLRIEPLLRQMANDYGPQAEEKGVELRIVPSRAVVRSDPTLLERVVRNLVSNAVTHTERGRVLVGCRHRPSGLVVQVWDTGPGIEDDQIEAIFEEFYQLPGTGRGRPQGLGLGLAIVQRLSSLLHHPVWVRSEVGRGSMFAVEVPYGVEENVVAPIEAPMAEFGGGVAGAVILVIDDEVEILNATSRLLHDWDCESIVATSVEDAELRLRAMGKVPDLVIADYNLEGPATGDAAISRLCATFEQPIPAIVITGDTDPAVAQEVQSKGYKLLHKPVRPAKLRALLEYYLLDWKKRQADTAAPAAAVGGKSSAPLPSVG